MSEIKIKPCIVHPNALVEKHLLDPYETSGFDSSEVELYDALLWACANNCHPLIERLKLSPTPWLFDDDKPIAICVRNQSFGALKSVIKLIPNRCDDSIYQAFYYKGQYVNDVLDIILPHACIDKSSNPLLSHILVNLTSHQLQRYSSVLDEKIAKLQNPGAHITNVFEWLNSLQLDMDHFVWIFEHVPLDEEHWCSLVSDAVRHQKWDLVECMQQYAPKPVYIGNPKFYAAAIERYNIDEVERIRSVVDFTKYPPEDAKKTIQSVIDGKSRITLCGHNDPKNAVQQLNIIEPLLICLSSEDRKECVKKMCGELPREGIDQLLRNNPDMSQKDLFPLLLNTGVSLSSLYFDKNQWSEEEIIELNTHQMETYEFYSWSPEKLRHPKIVSACCALRKQSLVKRVLHYGGKLSFNDMMEVLSWSEKSLDEIFITDCFKKCNINPLELKTIKQTQLEVLARSQWAHIVLKDNLLFGNLEVSQQDWIFKQAIENNNVNVVLTCKPFMEFEPRNNLLNKAAAVSLEMVEALLDVGDPYFKNSEPLWTAVTHQKVDIVKYLIPLCNPKGDNSAALREACKIKNIELVQLLLPVSDPHDEECSALQLALKYSGDEIVQMLLPVSNIKLVRSLIDNDVKDYFEEQISVYEKSVISEQIGAQNTSLKSRRM